MDRSALVLALFLSLISFPSSANAIVLKGHAWQVSDISKTTFTDDKIIKSLKTNWDSESSDEDLAHLYSFQIEKIFKISTAKVFLFTKFNHSHTTTLINERGDFLALEHFERSFMAIEDWIQKRSGHKICTEISHPNAEALFLMQINRFNPGNSCYYMIVPSHVWQRLEIYPTSTPKEFVEDDMIEACFNSADRRLFKKDRKSCKRWVQKLNQ